MAPSKVSRKSAKKPSKKGFQKKLKMPSTFCSICKRNFNRKNLLLEHNTRHHFIRRCPNCPKIFKRTRKFLLHLRSHLEDHPYECKNCLMSFNQKRDLLAHKAVERSSKKFYCDNCHKVFFYLASLNRHRLAHNGPPYPCVLCEAIFSNVPDGTVHLKNHVYRCMLCPKKVIAFPSNIDLVIHLYTVHRTEEYDPAVSEEIEHCVSTGAVNLKEDSDSDSMEELLSSSGLESDSDIDSHHKLDDIETVYNLKRKDKFLCFICYDLYPSCELLKSHMKDHHWYPCNLCPRFFANAKMLKKHKCKFTEVPSFRCDCGSVCENCKTVDDSTEVRVDDSQSSISKFSEMPTFGITDYTDVAQRNQLITWIDNIKSQVVPLDFDSFNLIGFHSSNLKVMLNHSGFNCVLPRECIGDLEELYSRFQDLSQDVVDQINRTPAQ